MSDDRSSTRREITVVVAVLAATGLVLLVLETVLGFAVLAGVGAAVLLRPRARAALAGLVALLGLVIVAIGVAGDASSSVLTVAAGAVVTVSAAFAAIRSRRWPPPRRGERMTPRREPGSRDTWDALDRGEDPTV